MFTCSSYKSMPVVWTSVQGHFLKCAPPPSTPQPLLISSIPKQKLPLWENCSATSASAWSQNHAHNQTLRSTASLFTNYRVVQLLPGTARCLLCSKWLVQRSAEKLSSHKHASQNFHKIQKQSLCALFEPEGKCVTTLQLLCVWWVEGASPGMFPLYEQTNC